ncbi:MAG: hypothetical protein ACOC6H_04120 [Thermoproteota archaeon]
MFKNMYDGCLLTLRSDTNKVSHLTLKIDEWSKLAQTRISRTLKTIQNKGIHPIPRTIQNR